jgi:hypothetical protein
MTCLEPSLASFLFVPGPGVLLVIVEDQARESGGDEDRNCSKSISNSESHDSMLK